MKIEKKFKIAAKKMKVEINILEIIQRELSYETQKELIFQLFKDCPDEGQPSLLLKMFDVMFESDKEEVLKTLNKKYDKN